MWERSTEIPVTSTNRILRPLLPPLIVVLGLTAVAAIVFESACPMLGLGGALGHW
jgi:hypothetical protein